MSVPIVEVPARVLDAVRRIRTLLSPGILSAVFVLLAFLSAAVALGMQTTGSHPPRPVDAVARPAGPPTSAPASSG